MSTTPVKALLSNITAINGVNAAIVLQSDGKVVDFIVKNGTVNININVIAEVIAKLYNTALELSKTLRLGELNMLSIEYTTGSVVITEIADGKLIAVVANKRALVGRIRMEIKRSQRMFKVIF
ncbi:roadblock/LC7 domain-containing protein [Hyperthermus butylicus]|uniref:Roadblock/LAMTOR2 domain-containing protein n=1 Tax=Hyperthermus butylicus (strain DSM 5456 / JCM 9403 / PLM1-5) TaxID=415426 RepID=A2BNB9_HYPBU|nr:roadblock/LC7 domain-containing protein [Hyperthermus butylicus]ABM81480.1 hypothetical protein Hbut_1667 [Hyperthermus butylicus DSM 5456]